MRAHLGLLWLLWLLVSPTLSGCSSALLGAGPSFDFGTFGVSGVENGVGTQLEVIGYKSASATGTGLGPALQLVGYSAANDADPIAFLTVDLRYRRQFVSASTLYWSVGTGGGLAWSAGVRGAAVPLQGEVGVARHVRRVQLFVGVRERLVVVIGSGSPQWDASNSVQLMGALGFARGDRLRTRE